MIPFSLHNCGLRLNELRLVNLKGELTSESIISTSQSTPRALVNGAMVCSYVSINLVLSLSLYACSEVANKSVYQ